ncbi:MAG: substrate-binding domain-containing protein [Pseudomonadota bacterium]
MARDTIQIVGSSTVYPFATIVAEKFGKKNDFKTPIIESTGSGGGLKLFCSGVGTKTPDITNSSRKIKKKEVKKCNENNVGGVTEVKIGYDGIVIANSKKAKQIEMTRMDIYLALAKDIPNPDGSASFVPNPYKTWKDVNKVLPDIKIEVLGPPPTSGTRDAFVELVLEKGGCKKIKWITAMKKKDKNKYKAYCHSIREDGGYVEAGENDNLIVSKLDANPNALGVFGFSFLDQNSNVIQGAIIEGVYPDFSAIADGSYSVSRPLYFYVKNAHLDVIPGMREYVNEFMSNSATGDDGYLAARGMIPMPEAERAKSVPKVLSFTPM